MNAAMISRTLSLIPDRVARVQSGSLFDPQALAGCPHPERITHLAQFLDWLGPLREVTKDDLRIFGLAGRRSTLAQTAGQYLPWIWRGLLVLALTGATLIIGEPVRSLVNPAFQAKMLMLAIAIAVTLLDRG